MDVPRPDREQGPELTLSRATTCRALLGRRQPPGAINLLSNAVRPTTSGRVAVRANSRVAAGGRHVVTIDVEDTGPGIEPGIQSDLRCVDQAEDCHPRGHRTGPDHQPEFRAPDAWNLVVESTSGTGCVQVLRVAGSHRCRPGARCASIRPGSRPTSRTGKSSSWTCADQP